MIKNILVSQPEPENKKSPYYDIAQALDAKITFRPFIKVEGIPAKEFKKQKVSILAHTAVVFTSRHAIDNFFNIAAELRLTIPETMKYFCTTEQIALYIQKHVQYRKRKIFFGTTGKIEDLMTTIVKHKSENYLIPLSDVHNNSVEKLFNEKKLTFTQCTMYRTVSNDLTEEELNSFNYDLIVFFSPNGIKTLKKNMPNYQQNKTVIAAFGPATAKEVISNGLRLDIEAPTKQHPSMTSAIEHFIQNAK